MTTWPVDDAKARFSEMLDACLESGPQRIARRGVEAAILVSAAEWERMKARPSLKDLLLSDEGRGEIALPSRGAWRRCLPSISKFSARRP